MPERAPASHRRRGRGRRVALAACGAVALASGAAWVRSRTALDMVNHTGGRLLAPTALHPDWIYERITYGAMTAPGSLRLMRSRYISVSPVEPDVTPWQAGNGWRAAHIPRAQFRDSLPAAFARSPLDFRIAGLGIYLTARSGEITRTLEAPFWLLITLAAAPPSFMAARAARRARRLRSGRCPSCGYPLADAPAPCPECGAAAARG